MKAVIIFHQGEKRIVSFHDHKVGRMFYKMVKEDYDKVYYVGRSFDTAKEPPEGYHPNRKLHYFWCPYCAKERYFLLHEGRGKTLRFCAVCDISSHDFYFKKFNQAWDGIRIRRSKARPVLVAKPKRRKNGR